jgi:hypothetical protein
MQHASRPEDWQAVEAPWGRTRGGAGGASTYRMGGALPAGRFLKTHAVPAAAPTDHPAEVTAEWGAPVGPEGIPIPLPLRSWAGPERMRVACVLAAGMPVDEAHPRLRFGAEAWTNTGAWSFAAGQPEAATGSKGGRSFRIGRRPWLLAQESPGAAGSTMKDGTAGIGRSSASQPVWLAPQPSRSWEGWRLALVPLGAFSFGRAPARTACKQFDATPASSAGLPGSEPGKILLPADGCFLKGEVARFPYLPVIWRCDNEIWRPGRVEVFFTKRGHRTGTTEMSAIGLLSAQTWDEAACAGEQPALSPERAGVSRRPGRTGCLAPAWKGVAGQGHVAATWLDSGFERWIVPGADAVELAYPAGLRGVREQGWFWPETSLSALPCRRLADAWDDAIPASDRWIFIQAEPCIRAWTNPAGQWRRKAGKLVMVPRAVIEPATLPTPRWQQPEGLVEIRAELVAVTSGHWKPASPEWQVFSAGRVIAATGWHGSGGRDWRDGRLALQTPPRRVASLPCPRWTRIAAEVFLPRIQKVGMPVGSGYLERMRLPLLVCRFPQPMVSSSPGRAGVDAPLPPFARPK